MGIDWVFGRVTILIGTIVGMVVAVFVLVPSNVAAVEKTVRLWWDVQARKARELGELPIIEVERSRLIEHTDIVSTREESFSREHVLPHVLVTPKYIMLKIQVFDHGDGWKVIEMEVVQAKRNNVQGTPTKEVFAGKKGGGPPWLSAVWFPAPLSIGITYLPCYPNPDVSEIEVRFRCERNRSKRGFWKGITRQRAWSEPIRVKDTTIVR